MKQGPVRKQPRLQRLHVPRMKRPLSSSEIIRRTFDQATASYDHWAKLVEAHYAALQAPPTP